MYSVYVSWFFTMSVSTFGYLRIEAHLQLPAAFRSLSRPSSAPDAKAFTLCSFSLELNQFSLFFLELLEFLEHFFGLLIILVKRFYPFALESFLPPFGEIVSFTQIGKTYNFFC